MKCNKLFMSQSGLKTCTRKEHHSKLHGRKRYGPRIALIGTIVPLAFVIPPLLGWASGYAAWVAFGLYLGIMTIFDMVAPR